MYVFDYGTPVGFRLARRHPDWIADLIVQNGNAYAKGLSDLSRGLVALRQQRQSTKTGTGSVRYWSRPSASGFPT